MVLDLSWSRREKNHDISYSHEILYCAPLLLILLFLWSLTLCSKLLLHFNIFVVLDLMLLYYCSFASDPNIFVVLDPVLLYYCSFASDPNIFVVLDPVLLYCIFIFFFTNTEGLRQ